MSYRYLFGEMRTLPFTDEINDLKLIVYEMQGCGFCTKLKQHTLKGYKDSIEFRDIANPEWHKVIQENQYQGFPTIVSQTTGKVLIGYRPKIKDIVEALS